VVAFIVTKQQTTVVLAILVLAVDNVTGHHLVTIMFNRVSMSLKTVLKPFSFNTLKDTTFPSNPLLLLPYKLVRW